MQGDRQHDVLILGGGIAGLTAAWQAASNQYSVGLVEAEAHGGLVANVGELDSYPATGPIAGAELAATLESAARGLGARFYAERVQSLGHLQGFEVQSDAGVLRSEHVIGALGARLRSLDVPGFTEFAGRGVSQCAFCDAGLYRQERAVVVGAGNAALQEALHLSLYAEEVVLVHRGRRIGALPQYRERVAQAENLRFRWRREVIEVVGDANGVTGVRLRHVQSGKEESLECHGVFAFIGVEPNAQLMAPWADLDESGYVAVDAQFQTRTERLYAIGALRQGFGGTLSAAMADAATVVGTIAQAG